MESARGCQMAPQALAEMLMRSQAEGNEAGVVGMDAPSVARSFAGVAACYRSWDASRGEVWEDV